MEARSTKPFGPARIVALALISITALGLAYLHFGTGKDAVSVPKGAHAGQLKLHSCDYPTENGSYRADCGTLAQSEARDPADRELERDEDEHGGCVTGDLVDDGRRTTDHEGQADACLHRVA